MTTNLFVIANVKQIRTGGSCKILLSFFRKIWGVGVLNSANFNSFHIRVEFGTILEDLRNFGVGGFEPPPRYATDRETTAKLVSAHAATDLTSGRRVLDVNDCSSLLSSLCSCYEQGAFGS